MMQEENRNELEQQAEEELVAVGESGVAQQEDEYTAVGADGVAEPPAEKRADAPKEEKKPAGVIFCICCAADILCILRTSWQPVS